MPEKIKTIAPVAILSLLLCCFGLLAQADATQIEYKFAGRGTASSVTDLLSRVLRNYRPLDSFTLKELDHLNSSVSAFDLSIAPSCPSLPRSKSAESIVKRSSLCFSISGGGPEPVKIVATSGPDLARGLATYLRSTSSYSFSWNRTGGIAGPPLDILDLPVQWPEVTKFPIATLQYRAVDVSYYQNVVASSYSHVWWSEEDWRRFTDWMALSGINVALMYGATELLEQQVFGKFGINESYFANWSNAPAWLAWSRGQSMHGVGENFKHVPAFSDFLTSQFDLARKRVGMLRALGITPVLPAFQGNVPPLLKTIHPTANITAQGGGRHWAAWLDSLDPLFGDIGDVWMAQLDQMFAPLDFAWFEADGYFTAGRPPWMQGPAPPTHDNDEWPVSPGTEEDARRHVQHAYLAINRTVAGAVMLYQGWTLGGDDAFTRGLVQAVPRGKLVISDMRCEDGRGGCEWTANNDFSFNGAPFIFGTLHDFGGVLGMWGSLSEIHSNFSYAVASAKSTVAGIGAYPEGINQNPAFYTYLFDANWPLTGKPYPVRAYLDRYAIERYNLASSSHSLVSLAQRAWRLLGETVYSDQQGPKRGNDFCSASDGLTSYPVGAEQEHVAPQPSWYNESKLWEVWSLLTDLASEHVGRDSAQNGNDGHAKTATPVALPSTLSYDLVNVGRECLAKFSNQLFQTLEAAGRRVNSHNSAAVHSSSARMAQLQTDADSLLRTDAAFSLTRWVSSAQSCSRARGGDETASKWFAWQARSQVTTWLPACDPNTPPGWPSSNTTKGVCGARSDLADYANKQWGGLVASYYRDRMACYEASRNSSLPTGIFSLNVTAYNVCIDRVSWLFQRSSVGENGAWPWVSGEDPVGLSQRLIAKWRPDFSKHVV